MFVAEPDRYVAGFSWVFFQWERLVLNPVWTSSECQSVLRVGLPPTVGKPLKSLESQYVKIQPFKTMCLHGQTFVSLYKV